MTRKKTNPKLLTTYSLHIQLIHYTLEIGKREVRLFNHTNYSLEGHTIYTPMKTCSALTGWHCCCRRSRHTHLADFGVGVVLYFKFLKSLLWIFLVMSVLSIPSLIIYSSGYKQIIAPSASKSTSSIQSKLAYFTLANVGECKFKISYN